MRIVDQFPRKVREIPTLWIPLPDGTRLAARVWLPEDADANPVPAILEYLPYRRRDGTAARDGGIHGYFAGHGYAGVRVDQRGTGDSDGVFRDEYLAEEQEDAAAVIAWLARQPWCDGKVGMMGISWGGFNALQVAARRPPALKAILTLCSTDDRYADDTHFMGGALLLGNLNWASVMLAYCSLPPDPAVVGERWREMWQRRLETTPLLAAIWAGHARRDDYWKQGSVCEDWAAIQCPVFAVGGWADAYTNAIPRLLEHLQAPAKALLGPWGHAWPQVGRPGPQIGFLQEAVRWWDHWLKGIDTGIMAEPRLLAWLQDSQPPATAYATWPGRWIQANGWPPAGREIRSWPLAPGRLGVTADAALPLESPQGVGTASGAWCPYGSDMPADQRVDDAGSLVFNSDPIGQPLALLGAPVALLEVSADRPLAALAVRLCDVAPDGASTRVSYGLLNLAHRDSHEAPQPLEPGRRYRVRIQLNDLGHVFAQGRRVRLAVSSAYWPTIWPQPDGATVTLHTGASRLELPVLPHPVTATKTFPEPEQAPPVPHAATRPGDRSRRVTVDPDSGETVVTAMKDQGATHFPDIDLTLDKAGVELYRIRNHDPLTAEGEIRWTARLDRPGWHIRTETRTLMTSTRDHFLIAATLDAYHDDRRIYARSWTETVPRDFA